MIPLYPARLESEAWQRELAEAICEPDELLRLLHIDPSTLDHPVARDNPFAMRVPRYFAGLMRPRDPRDPLLLQVLPLAREGDEVTGFTADPVGDLAAARAHGMLKKYRGRALLITTGACAVHCRYCFRRHFPYSEQSLLGHWNEALQALAGLPDNVELILSGGDPLSLSDRRLLQLVDAAERIPQLRRLRIHTRVPVVLPSRVTDTLVRTLAESRLRAVMVIHANHANEVTPTLAAALAPLAAAGVTLLNQSVLLKSVNDDADTLETLSESLSAAGILPYYLHLLDPVAGAAHFAVPRDDAVRLVETLRARLPGYLVPRLVCELPGQPSKTPVG